MPDVAGRIRFLPRVDSDNFLRLYQLVDVLLDPLHFSGGKTSYEAFALGVPVVTMPSQHLRGRITYALYQILGVHDAIARSPQEFAEIALRLAKDRDFRADVSRRILEASPRLFNDRPALAELEDFLERAVAAARKGEKV
jgi:predicted O-linked N-acetylglucosamine transferase (SPINDLY family)